MAEDGIDISGNSTKDVFRLHAEGRTYDMVITVCDPEAAAKCPVFPGPHHKVHWPFSDPSTFTGTETDKINKTRIVRDQIRAAVQEMVKNSQVIT
jgi:arsenate reductase